MVEAEQPLPGGLQRPLRRRLWQAQGGVLVGEARPAMSTALSRESEEGYPVG